MSFWRPAISLVVVHIPSSLHSHYYIHLLPSYSSPSVVNVLITPSSYSIIVHRQRTHRPSSTYSSSVVNVLIVRRQRTHHPVIILHHCPSSRRTPRLVHLASSSVVNILITLSAYSSIVRHRDLHRASYTSHYSSNSHPGKKTSFN